MHSRRHSADAGPALRATLLGMPTATRPDISAYRQMPMIPTITTHASRIPNRAPTKAFVSVGSRVDEETDVCVIEAMKVFNNIKAETRGTIAKVLCTNGQTVSEGGKSAGDAKRLVARRNIVPCEYGNPL